MFRVLNARVLIPKYCTRRGVKGRKEEVSRQKKALFLSRTTPPQPPETETPPKKRPQKGEETNTTTNNNNNNNNITTITNKKNVIIGLGLRNEKDITVNALDAIRRCGRIVGKLHVRIVLLHARRRWKSFTSRKSPCASRAFVESDGVIGMLKRAEEEDVAFLVVGDCFAATTHAD